MATGTVSPFPALDALVTRMEADSLGSRLGSANWNGSRRRKVAELIRPGPVLLRLAVRGFGVTLPR